MDQSDIEYREILALLRQGDFDTALAQCEIMIAGWPPDMVHQAVGIRGEVKWRCGDKMQALNDHRVASILNPDWAAHQYHLMVGHIEMDHFQACLKSADMLIAIDQRRSSKAFTRSALLHKLFCAAALGQRDEFEELRKIIDQSATIRIKGRDWSPPQMAADMGL